MQASVKLSAAISPLIIRRPPWGSRRVRLPLPLTPSTRGPKLLPGTPPASDRGGEGGQNPQKRPAYRAGLFFLIVSKSSKRKLCVPFGSRAACAKSPRLSSALDGPAGHLTQTRGSRNNQTQGGGKSAQKATIPCGFAFVTCFLRHQSRNFACHVLLVICALNPYGSQAPWMAQQAI